MKKLSVIVAFVLGLAFVAPSALAAPPTKGLFKTPFRLVRMAESLCGFCPVTGTNGIRSIPLSWNLPMA
jgi:hypothetical protein